MDPKKVFGQSVSYHRHKLGISQEKLAALAGLHRTYIADIERGTRNIGLINIVKIAFALKIHPSVLFSDIKSGEIKYDE